VGSGACRERCGARWLACPSTTFAVSLVDGRYADFTDLRGIPKACRWRSDLMQPECYVPTHQQTLPASF